MATKTWFGGSGSWGTGADWVLAGAPRAGDIAVIATGTVQVHDRLLIGLAIELQGTSDSTAPVLALTNVVLDTNLFLAGQPAAPGGYGKIDVSGRVVSAGNIVVGGSHIDPGDLLLSLGAQAAFINAGTIDVFDASQFTVASASASAVFVNDGMVLSGMGFPVFDTSVTGTGTFEVGPSTVGDQITFNNAVGAGETVALSTANVDERLYLGRPSEFHAAVTGLEYTNLIEMPNTPVDAASFSDGIYTLSDHGAVVARLDLVGVSGQNLHVTESGGGSIVSNGYAPPPQILGHH